MDIIQQAAVRKRSFELFYNGGSIWCEHLDGMGAYEDEVIAKFSGDKSSFLRPSGSAFMIVNLDKTDITKRITEMIVTTIMESGKVFRKIAFVGVSSRQQKLFMAIKSKGIAVSFLNDYEKAKEWLLP